MRAIGRYRHRRDNGFTVFECGAACDSTTRWRSEVNQMRVVVARGTIDPSGRDDGKVGCRVSERRRRGHGRGHERHGCWVVAPKQDFGFAERAIAGHGYPIDATSLCRSVTVEHVDKCSVWREQQRPSVRPTRAVPLVHDRGVPGCGVERKHANAAVVLCHHPRLPVRSEKNGVLPRRCAHGKLDGRGGFGEDAVRAEGKHLKPWWGVAPAAVAVVMVPWQELARSGWHPGDGTCARAQTHVLHV